MPFATALSEVEDSLYQTKNRSGQDPLNYPIRLNNRIGALMGVVASADGRPTQQSYDVDKVLTVGARTRISTKLASGDQRESAEDQRDVAGGGAQGDRVEGADRVDRAAQRGSVRSIRRGTAIPMAW